MFIKGCKVLRFDENNIYRTINDNIIPRSAIEEYIDKFKDSSNQPRGGEFSDNPALSDTGNNPNYIDRFVTIIDPVIKTSNYRFDGKWFICDLDIDDEVYKDYKKYLDVKLPVLGCRFLTREENPDGNTYIITLDLLDKTTCDIRYDRTNEAIGDINKAIQELHDKKLITDGYHTFDELYDHRMALFAIVCNQNTNMSWKSKNHHVGGDPMFEGMFIVGINTDEGQVTYHYNMEHWDRFKVTELENAPIWDGHTPQMCVERLLKLAEKGRI